GPDFAGSGVDERQHRGLVGDALTALAGLVAVPKARLAADPCLVSDDGAAHGLEQSVVRHRLTNAVHHEPRGAGTDTVFALDFAGCDPVLTGAHLKDDEHPFAESDFCAVE